MRQPTVITDNSSLRQQYNSLKKGDVVVGRLNLLPSEEFMLLDLVDRQIKIIPSALSQMACRSKAMQVNLFSSWMIPHTVVVHDHHQLLAALSSFPCQGKVVTKLDRKNAGLGIHRWSSLEDVYNNASLGNIPFPFVLQPYIGDYLDLRVIIVGDYLEVYQRSNSANFRNNLHCGGKSNPFELNVKQMKICREVMERGRFPYAFIDLMVAGLDTYFSEINLRGGIRGAQIDPKTLSLRVEEVHAGMLSKI